MAVPLSTRGLVLGLGFASGAALLIQFALGAPISILAITALAICLGFAAFLILGVSSIGGWVALAYVLGSVVIALLAKSLFGQQIDSNLHAPFESFAAVTATTGGLVAALVVVSRINVGPPLLAAARSPRFLSFMSWATLVLGVGFWFLNRWFQDVESGFGGIALFRNLLFMAVIARTAMLLEKSSNRRSVDVPLVLIVGIGVLLGMIENSKEFTALPVVAYFVTALFYRRGLPVQSLAVVAVGALLFVSLIAPLTHAYRAIGQQEMTLDERVAFVISNTVAVLQDPSQFNVIEQLAASQFEDGYYDYFGGGQGQMLLGRYTSVQHIDPVIAAVDASQPRGGDAVWPALERLVPSFLYPDKPRTTEAFETLVHYRLIEPSAGPFPTLPLTGQSYAAYGWLGVLTIPFLAFVVFLLVTKKFGWHLYGNIYAIFVFCSFVIVYVGQADFAQYVGFAIRDLPLFAVVFFGVGWTYRALGDRMVANVDPASHGQQVP